MKGSLPNLFRQLRNAWFDAHVALYTQERHYERGRDAALRERINDEARALFDRQTEELISGHDRPLTPRCIADVDR